MLIKITFWFSAIIIIYARMRLIAAQEIAIFEHRSIQLIYK